MPDAPERSLTVCTMGRRLELMCSECGACIKCVSADFATGCEACNTAALRVQQIRRTNEMRKAALDA